MPTAPILANAFVDLFHRGGPIMYPVLLTAIFAVCIVVERIAWWLNLSRKRDASTLDKVFAAVEAGNSADAIALSSTSEDPVVRMIHHGLNHRHSSLQSALEVAAGHELQRAGRFLTAMDTVVTLGPLLGLLGTVTGIMGAFSSIGSSELAVEKVTGGIGEALIATAFGLGIAIVTLIPMNFFHARVARLQFELEAAATNVALLRASREPNLP